MGETDYMQYVYDEMRRNGVRDMDSLRCSPMHEYDATMWEGVIESRVYDMLKDIYGKERTNTEAG